MTHSGEHRTSSCAAPACRAAVLLVLVSYFYLFACASKPVTSAREASPITEQAAAPRPAVDPPDGSNHVLQPDAAIQKPNPLTSPEIAQLKALLLSTTTFGIEFPHCHQHVVLGRWGGQVRGRDHIPTERYLTRLETLEHDEPLLAPRVAEGYVKLVYSTWRDLLTHYFSVDGADPSTVRHLFARRQRIEPRMFAALRRASDSSHKHWSKYRYELALHHLMLRDYPAARDAATALLHGSRQPYRKQAALLTAMSYLKAPAEPDNLKRAHTFLMRVASTNDRTSHTLIASCFLAEVHARLGDMPRALDELRALQQARDPFGLWRVAQRRLNELEQQTQ